MPLSSLPSHAPLSAIPDQLILPDSRLSCRCARIAWHRGDKAAAIQHYQQALQSDLRCLEALDSLARLHLERRELTPATNYSAAAIEVSPSSVDVAITRASVLVAIRNTAAAWAIIEPLLAAGQRSVRLVVLFTRIAPQLKKEAQALSLVLGLLGRAAA